MSSTVTCESVGIHPIVVLTISDFYNRMKVTSEGKVTRVYGALMGQRVGAKAEIFSAFEFFNLSINPMTINLDMQYIDTRRDLATQLFPKLDIIGFFSTNASTAPNEMDAQLLNAMKNFGVITPIYLILSTSDDNAKDLPIETFEVDKISKKFNKVNHVIEGWESERICLETVTKSTNLDDGQSGLIQNLNTMKNALSVLKENLLAIKKGIKSHQNDLKFKEMLEDLIINYPSVKDSDYPEMIGEKKKEIFILNNICAGVLQKSFLGKSEKILEQDFFHTSTEYY